MWSSSSPDSHNNYPDLSGFAIYNASVWSSANVDYKNGSLSLTDPAAPDPLMFLPAAGTRHQDDSHVYHTGYNGYYWSCTVSGMENSRIGFTASYVAESDATRRAYGFSVRCIAE
ncbi:MAG: fibrobacter succinogenes major paralogous domain-containing protein [Candidatus Symbiothrix sp.]|jgi:hypothetical protein|nr:fibrobacter succinogenes major paralogous domain-containing protein [Candidatus Symbiothrix sp.]